LSTHMRNLNQAILGYLLQKYKKKGKNFYFKSGQLSRELNLTASLIGRVCKNLHEKNLLACYNGHCRNSSRVWKTVFA
jgi:DNA-binding MarR family transcriptional regulator